jgi:hypothetical protein
MKTLRDLLSRRDELVHGVIETHGNAGNAMRREILWLKVHGNDVEFTVTKTFVSNGSDWALLPEPLPCTTVSFSADLKITENFRPQFDLGGGAWAILYPNTDSVRIP